MKNKSTPNLWKTPNQLRGVDRSENTTILLRALFGGDVDIPNSWQEIHPILSRAHAGYNHTPPNYVINLFKNYFKDRDIKTVLDPWSQYGVILAALGEENKNLSSFGIEKDINDIDIAIKISKGANNKWANADPYTFISKIQGEFDAVVSSPPFGLKRRARKIKHNQEVIQVKDAETPIILLEAARMLSKDGAAVFVHPNNFAWPRPNNVISHLNKFNLFINAIIALPDNAYHPWTTVPLNVFFISRKETEFVYVTNLDQDKQISELVENIHKHQLGKPIHDGYLIEIADFRSFQTLVLRDEVELEAKKSGTKVVHLGDISKLILRGKPRKEDGGFEEIPNAVYLPLIGNSPAVTRLADLNIRPHNYSQIVLLGDSVFAEYVAGYFNSPLGMKVRKMMSHGGVIPQIRKKDLNSAQIILPNIESQIKIVNAHNSLQDMHLMLQDKERILWADPKMLAQTLTDIDALQPQEQQSFQDWMNSLPFPLASILWRYSATERANEKVEHLFHFFEAFAQFITTLMLSCYYSDEVFFEKNKANWFDLKGEHAKTLERATFGNWVVTGERLAKFTRRMLSSKKSRDKVFDHFHTDNIVFIETIIGKRLFGVLKAVNANRNDWQGHGGVTGDTENQRRLTSLESDLTELREAIQNLFEGYVLLAPQEARQARGVFNYRANKIMGTVNTPFKTFGIKTNVSLEDGELYFQDLSRRDPIKMIPFIRLLSNPKTGKNSCYFYSRISKDGIRFVTYHYDQQSDLTKEDDSLMEFFAVLNQE